MSRPERSNNAVLGEAKLQFHHGRTAVRTPLINRSQSLRLARVPGRRGESLGGGENSRWFDRHGAGRARQCRRPLPLSVQPLLLDGDVNGTGRRRVRFLIIGGEKKESNRQPHGGGERERSFDLASTTPGPTEHSRCVRGCVNKTDRDGDTLFRRAGAQKTSPLVARAGQDKKVPYQLK